MKKLLLPLLAILYFTSCQKEINSGKLSEETAGANANKQAKITVCHYDAVTGTSKTIEISQNALSAHLSHGDLPGDCSAILTTTICDQEWMVKNLDVTTYRNGDPIPQVTDPTVWAALTTGAWCYYGNNPSNGAIYGKLYNWYAVNDSRGLAPIGWHVPSHAEWTILSDCLGGHAIAGGKIKSTGTLEAGTGLWLSPNAGATDSIGFTGHPNGVRTGGIAIDFASLNGGAYWWSSTNYSSQRAWSRMASFQGTILDWGIGVVSGEPPFIKTNGMAVRCVRD